MHFEDVQVEGQVSKGIGDVPKVTNTEAFCALFNRNGVLKGLRNQVGILDELRRSEVWYSACVEKSGDTSRIDLRLDHL